MSKAVVVTGAASGIGRAVAEHLAGTGWRVVGLDVDGPALRTVMGALAGGSIAVVGDVALADTHLAAARDAGVCSGWVNCAGVTLATPLDDPDPDVVHRLLAVNQLGTFWGVCAAVRNFLEHGTPGSIVNVSSVHAARSHPGYGAYEMTKAAVEALTRNVAVAYGSRGIRANAVAPGAVATPALVTAPEEHLELLRRQSPLGRLAAPAEIATAVAFLLADEASFVSGEVLTVDGGWSSALMREGTR